MSAKEGPTWTKGPWRIDEDSDLARGGYFIVATLEDHEGPYEVTICGRGEWEHRAAMSRANANLLSAAPEMYEALRALWLKFELLIVSGRINAGTEHSALAEAALAALAKARGEK